MRSRNRTPTTQIRFVWILSVICFLAGFGISQVTPEWKGLTTSNKEVTVFLPSDIVVVNENGEFALYAYSDDTSIEVSKQKVDKPRNYVEKIDFSGSKTGKLKVLDFGEFLVKQLTFEGDKAYATHLYIASSKNYYYVSVSAKTKDNPSLVRFFDSFQLGGKPFFDKSGQKSSTVMPTDVIEKLQSSQIVKAALEKKCTSDIRYKYDIDDPNKKSPDTPDKKPSGTIEYSRHLVILRKIKPLNSSGVFGRRVQLRVQFQADGCVGDIFVFLGGKDTLTIEAIKAASQIKFLPAEIAGKPIAVVKVVEYSF